MTETLTGVQALARLLLVRQQLDRRDGLRTATLVSGYPGSPLGTFDLTLESLGDQLAAHEVVHRPGLNEELAAATVWGSQMGMAVPYADVDGVAGAWYGKTPGLDRAGDALKHANAMGSGPGGGVVLFCGDDPTAKSSTLPCDSQPTFEDACVPVLYPGDPQDVIDLGVHAFRMSRQAGPWVGLKVVTTVADGLGTVDPGLDRHPPLTDLVVEVDGRPWRHQPQATIGPHQIPQQEALVVRHRLVAAQAYALAHGLDRIVGAGPGAAIGIVCAGKTYFDVVGAFAALGVGVDDLAGLGVRILRLAMTYPLVPQVVLDLAGAVDQIVVVEEKRPFVERQLRAILHEAASPVPVQGKRDATGQALVSEVGELDVDAVAEVLVRVVPALPERPGVAARQTSPSRPTRPAIPVLALPPRPPGFCSGCPHNRSTVFPAGALVGGGVGCHGIMYFEARHAGMTSLPPTPMGAEGVPWLGLEPFVDQPHLIQNLGDGTLSHSGSLAIRAAVAAGADVTFKVLYNRAVAMTGGQDVTGLVDVPALTRAFEAEGVAKVVVCAEDPSRYGRRARWATGVEVHGRDDLDEIQERLRATPGVTVLIYDQQCAAEARRLRKRGLQPEPPRRVVINEAVCEGCGDCGVKSNCLSVLPVETEMGTKRQIHEPSCNRDYTCLDGDCPSFVTLTPDPRGHRVASARAIPDGPRASRPVGVLPDPPLRAWADRFALVFTGIGGTGVVTANRIIAAAAEAAGWVVGGLDQTGLSQKAGAVVSHLHLARRPEDLGAVVTGTGGADLYLSGDILQAASAANLARVDPGRTLAVVDPEVTPTAAMLQAEVVAPTDQALRDQIAGVVGTDRVAFVDSKGIAEGVFANHLLANVALVGAAFQMGALPLSAADLEAGLAGTGRAAEANRQAFEWGRWAVHDPAAVAARVADAGRDPEVDLYEPSPKAWVAADALRAAEVAPGEVGQLIRRRTAQVVDYQDRRRARRYLELVRHVAGHDDPAQGLALTRAVAESWFRLLTYKDEYEVARLHLKVDYDALAERVGIEGPYRVTYHLHPPVLRRLGLSRKLPLGRPYEASFQVLARMKRLRGTPLDLFGRDPDRIQERALIEEYDRLVRQLVGQVEDGRSALRYDQQVAVAASVLEIKGYAGIKDESVTRWRAQVAELRSSDAVTAAAGNG